MSNKSNSRAIIKMKQKNSYTTSAHRYTKRLLLLTVLSVNLLSCVASPTDDDTTKLQSQTFSPTGLLVIPSTRQLAVVSSNAEGRFPHGALLLADLNQVDLAVQRSLENPENPKIFTLNDAYRQGVNTLSFAYKPIINPSQTQILLNIREQNLMNRFPIQETQNQFKLLCLKNNYADKQKLEQGSLNYLEQEYNICAQSRNRYQYPANDPYAMLIYSEENGITRGITSYLRSSLLSFWEIDSKSGSAKISNKSREMGNELERINQIALRTSSTGKTVFALANKYSWRDTGALHYHAQLLWFNPETEEKTQINRFDLHQYTQTLQAADLVVSKDQNTLYILAKAPEAIIKLQIIEKDGKISLNLAGVNPVCKGAMELHIDTIPLGNGEDKEKLFISCFTDDTVIALDPDSLEVTDRISHFGRGPFDLVTDLSGSMPLLYVSYFSDDSIGVFSLLNADGLFKLKAIGRIGKQRKKPEDGR